jgi:glycosyltransferase involved in cell wall biosynthesis
MKYKKISIIIPAYNEGKTILEVVKKIETLNTLGLEKEIIIVNDTSKDDTLEKITNYKNGNNIHIQIIDNVKNAGKTQSVQRGIEMATGDLVVVQDADSELDPNDLTQFIEKFLNTDVDVIFGNRYHDKQKHVYLSYSIGSKVLSFVSNVFTYPRIKVWIKDMPACYKMMRTDVAKAINHKLLKVSRFGIEAAVTGLTSRYKINGKHLKCMQMDIHYYPRTRNEGKHLKTSDGIAILGDILKSNLL